MIRAVLDANVFVSAIVSPAGLPARILAARREGAPVPRMLPAASAARYA
jgi:predicted nucleic acid-binding protein